MRHDNFFEDLLTMDELLEYLKNQYSKHTIYKWVQTDKMPHVKIKGKLWFPKKEICRWFYQNAVI